ncbi:class II aldolase/adducin family protein [Scytonema hofmannii FACHB-248]|uniref:Class II aldolase/adducin family protein n=1 Tax=Scytonema hofmannii FACHB-248 TaxID=1842502 RepID=A0ABR8GU83_9CYAN|nr:MULTISPECIES: class II aldolase/adducin family protein [Nostocales]MBD2607031.1 class II aldolase/adducin family protein [Scytonema hofmannii FACHB-248]
MTLNEQQLRVDLAAAFRWSARLNYHEGIANHFSVSVSDDGKKFLLNPQARHFSLIRASELLLLDADNPDALSGKNVPEATAWFLHAPIHQHLPHARCIIHVHTPYATTLCCLQNKEILMLNNKACRFYKCIAYDSEYNGMPLDKEEGMRAVRQLEKDKSILFMGNHGILVIGQTVAEAFDELYYLEKVAQIQLLALSSRQKLDIIPDEIAAKTRKQWIQYRDFSLAHLDELKKILDAQEPDYKL